MDNRIKMKIKAIPFVSCLAKYTNRTLGRFIRSVFSYPSRKKKNNELIERLSLLKKGEIPRIWYFGVPQHSNLGDQAQKFCILKWLKTNYPNWEIVGIPSVEFNGGIKRSLDKLGGIIDSNDIIVMQSGHTMDGLHMDEPAHRNVPKTFVNNKIVFFPTSITESSRYGLKKDSNAIDSHRRTLFLARDSVSYEKARELYPHLNIRLYPDVVTSLIGVYSFSFKRSGILLCTRNDGEKLYSYKEIDRLAENLSKISSLDRVDTTVDWKGLNLDSEEAWRRIEGVIASYAKYQIIVTDRYHGTIFSRIAGTPVVVLKTTDHKVVSGAQWFVEAGDNGIAVADDLNKVVEIVQKLSSEYPEGCAAPAFAAGYYDCLRSEIEAM